MRSGSGPGKGRAGRTAALLLILSLTLTSGWSCAGAGVPNLPRAKRQVTAYYEDGRYQRDVSRVVAEARRYLEKRLGRVERPALVLDIDETSLSSWSYMSGLDFGFDWPTWKSWVARVEAPPLTPTLDLYRFAREHEVAVFFVTARRDDEAEATERNLRQAGYDGWQGLYLRPTGGPKRSTAEYKADARRQIAAQGYAIVVNLGDQSSDLAGGYAERAFLLPNPFYGSE